MQRTVLLLAAVLPSLLAGCASGPSPLPPDQAAQVPPVSMPPATPAPAPATPLTAEPRVEPLRADGPNRPYEVGGRTYVPLQADTKVMERGTASWYAPRLHGRRTASGERYDRNALTAAHPTLPIPSYVLVRNLANGRRVVVRVNDRGPFSGGFVIDLSQAAAQRLGIVCGPRTVEVERLTHDEIRSGSWRRETPAL